jgi:pyruvate/2-oxoglutarate dehydrogenase complex dihydrolipoamide acyltransferase (E2) component
VSEFVKSSFAMIIEEGDWVAQDETIANVETDKTTV